MKKLFQDILDEIQSPLVQKGIEIHILTPILHRIFHIVYPYVIGVVLLWIVMFVCLALILLILVRSSIADVLRK